MSIESPKIEPSQYDSDMAVGQDWTVAEERRARIK